MPSAKVFISFKAARFFGKNALSNPNWSARPTTHAYCGVRSRSLRTSNSGAGSTSFASRESGEMASRCTVVGASWRKTHTSTRSSTHQSNPSPIGLSETE